MTTSGDAQGRIVLARRNLTSKLAELRKRETRVREAISPMRHLGNPWLRLGLAALVGYRLGRRPRTAPAAPAARTGLELVPRQDSLMQGIIRAGAIAVTTAIMRHLAEEFVERLATERTRDDGE